jgi:hypothetical protein
MIKTFKRTILAAGLVCTMCINSVTFGTTPGTDIIKAEENTAVLSNPVVDESGVTTWDTVYFGKYWQNDTDCNGKADKKDEKDPIRWRVLSVNGNDAFLMADRILDGRRYHDWDVETTWENCSLRVWLNNEFLNDAFTGEEQDAIMITDIVNEDNPENRAEGGNNTFDKVYILSFREAVNVAYGFDENYGSRSLSRCVACTDYTKSHYSFPMRIDNPQGIGDWWLRTPAYKNKTAIDVCIYGNMVDLDGCFVEWYCGVRPVMHLNLDNSKFWTYAGKVKSSDIDKVKFGDGLKITKLTNKKGGKLVVRCNMINGAQLYRIQYADNRKMNNAKYVDGRTLGTTKFTIKRLKKGKTYYVRVRPYDRSIYNKKIYGKWSKIKKIKIKK